MYLLAVASRTRAIGTADGIWVGIGVVGTAILGMILFNEPRHLARIFFVLLLVVSLVGLGVTGTEPVPEEVIEEVTPDQDRKSTRLNSSHVAISYAVFGLKKRTHK